MASTGPKSRWEDLFDADLLQPPPLEPNFETDSDDEISRPRLAIHAESRDAALAERTEAFKEEARRFAEMLSDPGRFVSVEYFSKKDPRFRTYEAVQESFFAGWEAVRSRHLNSTDLDLVWNLVNYTRQNDFGLSSVSLPDVAKVEYLSENLLTMAPTLAALIRNPLRVDPSTLPGLQHAGTIHLETGKDLSGLYKLGKLFDEAGNLSQDAAEEDGTDEERSAATVIRNYAFVKGEIFDTYERIAVVPDGAGAFLEDLRRLVLAHEGCAFLVMPLIRRVEKLAELDGGTGPLFVPIYAGVDVSNDSDPLKRCIDDYETAAKGRLYNLLGSLLSTCRSISRIDVYAYRDLQVDPSLVNVDTRRRELDQTISLTELVAVTSLYPYRTNRKSGGWLEGVPAITPEETKQDEVFRAWIAQQDAAALDNDGAPDLSLANAVANIFDSVDGLIDATVAEGAKSRQDFGRKIDPGSRVRVVDRAKNIPTCLGHVVSQSFFKDLPVEQHDHETLAGFQREDGVNCRAAAEHEAITRSVNPQIPEAPTNYADFVPYASKYFNPVLDLWAQIIVHIEIWIVLLQASWIFVTVRPILLFVYSSKVWHLLVKRHLRTIWNSAQQTKLQDLLVHGQTPANYNAWIVIIIIVVIIWTDLPIPDWLDHVGTLAIVDTGPFANNLGLALADLHPGRNKYVTFTRLFVWRVERLVAWQRRILDTIVRVWLKRGDVPPWFDQPGDAGENLLLSWFQRLRDEANETFQKLGLLDALQTAKNRLSDAENFYRSLTTSSAVFQRRIAGLIAGISAETLLRERSVRASKAAEKTLARGTVLALGAPSSQLRRRQAQQAADVMNFCLDRNLALPSFIPRALYNDTEKLLAWITRVPEGVNLLMSGKTAGSHPALSADLAARIAYARHRFGNPRDRMMEWMSCFESLAAALQHLGTDNGFFDAKLAKNHPMVVVAFFTCARCGDDAFAKSIQACHRCPALADEYAADPTKQPAVLQSADSHHSFTPIQTVHGLFEEFPELAARVELVETETEAAKSDTVEINVISGIDAEGNPLLQPTGIISYDPNLILRTRAHLDRDVPRQWIDRILRELGQPLAPIYAHRTASDKLLSTLSVLRLLETVPSKAETVAREQGFSVQEIRDTFSDEKMTDYWKLLPAIFAPTPGPATCLAKCSGNGARHLPPKCREIFLISNNGAQKQHYCLVNPKNPAPPPTKTKVADIYKSINKQVIPNSNLESFFDLPVAYRRRLFLAKKWPSDDKHKIANEIWATPGFH